MPRTIESLEFRKLLSAVYPSASEQYMVELYNWARANPSAAATKYGVALNEGIASGTISTSPKQPIAISPLLVDASRTFAQYMIDHDQFGHYVDGSDPEARMKAAGYSFNGSWGWGENLAMRSSSGSLNATTTVAQEFADLYIDAGIAGRGHRTNIFKADWKEMGSGVSTGNYNGWNGLISAQDFAYSGTSTFLTGVAYNDTSHDSFYTPGEQLGSVVVTAVRNSDDAKFSTSTWSSGGYSLALPAGTYTVYAGGGSLSGYVRYDNVVIGTQNVKRDFRPDLVNSSTGPGSGTTNTSPALVNGVLTVASTSNDDTFAISVASGTLKVVRNGTTLKYTASAVKQIILSAGDGNDTITIDATVTVPTSLRGGNGNDSIKGSSGADVLRGDEGNDTLFSGAGNDKIYGYGGDDFINGETGADRIWGGNDNDLIFGGSHSDALYGEAGLDTLFGQNQSDTLDGGTGADYMSGGSDIDTVDYTSRTAALVIELSVDTSIALGTSGEAGEQDKVLTDIENINGGAGADKITASNLVNIIHGNGGNDTIYALGGADKIYGDAGADRLITKDSVKDIIDGGADRDTVTGDALDSLTGVEVH